MNNKGFTFVEILAVIAIMAILSGIAIAGVSRYRDKQIQNNYDSIATSSYDSFLNYLMKNGDTDSVSLSTLKDEDFISNIVDPVSKGTDCSGYVYKNNDFYKAKNTTSKIKYVVDLCCSNYKKRYFYPSDESVDIEKCENSIPNSNSVTCSAGTYLKANANSCSNCQSGYYCPGGTFEIKNIMQGRNDCPNGYKNSQEKSSSINQCFMEVPENNYIKVEKDEVPTKCDNNKGSEAHKAFYGNKSTCNISIPSVPTVTLCKWKNDVKPTSCSGLTSYSSNSWSKEKILTVPSSTGATRYEFTTTGKTENLTDQVQAYRNIAAEGVSTIKWRACNLAGCSAYSDVYTIKYDNTDPTVLFTFSGTKGSIIGNEMSGTKYVPISKVQYQSDYAFIGKSVTLNVKSNDNLSSTTNSIACKKWKTIEAKPSAYPTAENISSKTFSDIVPISGGDRSKEYYYLYDCKMQAKDAAGNVDEKSVVFAKGNGWLSIQDYCLIGNRSSDNCETMIEWKYYSGGELLTGWQKLYWYSKDYPDGQFDWYYFFTGNETVEKNGSQCGSHGADGKYYMARGWCKNIGGYNGWYFFSWFGSGNDYYPMYPGGSMLKNGTYQINDYGSGTKRNYTFDSSGKCISGYGC